MGNNVHAREALMRLNGVIAVMALAVGGAVALAGQASAADIAGAVSTKAVPSAAAVGALVGGAATPGSAGYDAGSLSEMLRNGRSTEPMSDFRVEAQSDGGVGYNVMLSKKIFSW